VLDQASLVRADRREQAQAVLRPGEEIRRRGDLDPLRKRSEILDAADLDGLELALRARERGHASMPPGAAMSATLIICLPPAAGRGGPPHGSTPSKSTDPIYRSR